MEEVASRNLTRLPSEPEPGTPGKNWARRQWWEASWPSLTCSSWKENNWQNFKLKRQQPGKSVSTNITAYQPVPRSVFGLIARAQLSVHSTSPNLLQLACNTGCMITSSQLNDTCHKRSTLPTGHVFSCLAFWSQIWICPPKMPILVRTWYVPNVYESP